MNANTQRQRGFTLIELMLAVVLGAVVMMAVPTLLCGSWREGTRYTTEQVTMNEIKVLEAAFQKETRGKANSTYQPNKITFDDGAGGTSTFEYDAANQSIIFTMDNGTQMQMLEKSVVNGFSIIPVPGTDALRMVVTIKESELHDKENTYSITVKTR